MNGTLERLSQMRREHEAEEAYWRAQLSRRAGDLLLGAAFRLEVHRVDGMLDDGDRRAQLLLETLRELHYYL